jgi:hypothetical protein
MELIEVIQQYKEIKQAIEDLESQLADVRLEISTLTGNQEYQGHGLTIAFITPEPTLDWKTAIKALKIPESKLAPFFKERPAYFRYTIKRSIDI